MNLPTNNGTVNPYTNYVRPAMDQQTFNAHVSEQINGVQTMQRVRRGHARHGGSRERAWIGQSADFPELHELLPE